MNPGVYIVYFDYSLPPPLSFIFSPASKDAAAERFMEFIAPQKNNFKALYPVFYSTFSFFLLISSIFIQTAIRQGLAPVLWIRFILIWLRIRFAETRIRIMLRIRPKIDKKKQFFYFFFHLITQKMIYYYIDREENINSNEKKI